MPAWPRRSGHPMTGGQPDRAIDAVIFDLDGVLADTEIIWFEAMRALLAPAEFTWEQNLHLVGSTSEFTTEWIRTEFQRTESPADLERIIGAAVNEHVERVTLEPMAGATELVEGLRSRGLPVAVASQSSPRWVERTLRQIGLLPAFEFFVTASEVPVRLGVAETADAMKAVPCSPSRQRWWGPMKAWLRWVARLETAPLAPSTWGMWQLVQLWSAPACACSAPVVQVATPCGLLTAS